MVAVVVAEAWEIWRGSRYHPRLEEKTRVESVVRRENETQKVRRYAPDAVAAVADDDVAAAAVHIDPAI